MIDIDDWIKIKIEVIVMSLSHWHNSDEPEVMIHDGHDSQLLLIYYQLGPRAIL